MLDLGRFDILATFIATIAMATACGGQVSGGTAPGSGGVGGTGGGGGSDDCTSTAATCTTGRCLMTLASKAVMPPDGPYDMPGIAVDPTSVYWTEYGGTVKKLTPK